MILQTDTIPDNIRLKGSLSHKKIIIHSLVVWATAALRLNLIFCAFQQSTVLWHVSIWYSKFIPFIPEYGWSKILRYPFKEVFQQILPSKLMIYQIFFVWPQSGAAMRKSSIWGGKRCFDILNITYKQNLLSSVPWKCKVNCKTLFWENGL